MLSYVNVEKDRWWILGRHMGGDGLRRNIHTCTIIYSLH